MFEQLGFTLAALEPGKPTGMYHAESSQEDFLVLAGTCLLMIEEEERELRAWDFVHCPPGTLHTFVGTGDRPSLIFMTGARREDGTIVYPVSGDRRRPAAPASRPKRLARTRHTRRSAHWRLGKSGRLAPTALGLGQLRQKVGPLVQGATAVASPGRRRRSRPRACR